MGLPRQLSVLAIRLPCQLIFVSYGTAMPANTRLVISFHRVHFCVKGNVVSEHSTKAYKGDEV